MKKLFRPKNMYGEPSSKEVRKLLKSEIFGPKDYFKGKSNKEILEIAQPLIDFIQSGASSFRIPNDSLSISNPGPKMITKITNLTPEGKHFVINWIYYHDKRDREKLLNPNVIRDPFTYTYFGFLRLSDEHKEKIMKMASIKNRPFCTAFFKRNPKADWVVIAHKAKNIIMQGTSDNQLSCKDMEELEKRIGKMIFVYPREKTIEQVPAKKKKVTRKIGKKKVVTVKK